MYPYQRALDPFQYDQFSGYRISLHRQTQRTTVQVFITAVAAYGSQTLQNGIFTQVADVKKLRLADPRVG